EAHMAIELKALIKRHFHESIDVFVSSDHETLRAGDDWFVELKRALNACKIVIILCSPVSVTRPWINIEMGVAWDGIPNTRIIPLCHSGMAPIRLPFPLKQLQAKMATEVEGLENIFRELAKAIDANPPDEDFKVFIKKVTRSETVERVKRF